MKLTKNMSSGMSLVEVLVSLSIFSILTLTMTSFISDMYKNQARLENREMLRQLQRDVEFVVSSGVSCGITDIPIQVSDPNWAAATTYNIQSLSSPSMVLSAGSQYDRLSVTQLELTGFYNRTNQSSSYVGLDSGDLTQDLNIQAGIKISTSVSTGATMTPIYIPVKIKLNAARSRITSCEILATSTQLEELCNSVNGDWQETVGKCSLPCPEGSVRAPDDSKCLFSDESNDDDENGNTVSYCAMSNICNIRDIYDGANYQ